MKRMFLAVLLFGACALSSATGAVDSSLDSFTPVQWSSLVSQHGWHEMGSVDGDDYAYTYGKADPMWGFPVMLRKATRGMSGKYVSVIFLAGFVDCRGAPQKKYPDFLMMGDYIDADTRVDNNVGTIPIKPHSALAKAVVASCDAISSEG